MINEKMTFADLKCFEEALHRKLTDNEAMLGYTKGFKALLDFIGMTEEKYMAYLQLLKLLVTYCTEDKIKFAKLRQSADYSNAFAVLQSYRRMKLNFFRCGFRLAKKGGRNCIFSILNFCL